MPKINKTVLDSYRTRIASATSKEELRNISYEAFLQDTTTIWNITMGKRCLSNEVTKLCTRRELELDGYTKEQIREMERADLGLI